MYTSKILLIITLQILMVINDIKKITVTFENYDNHFESVTIENMTCKMNIYVKQGRLGKNEYTNNTVVEYN